MIVARTFSATADTALVNNAANMAAANRTRVAQRFCMPSAVRNLRPGASGKTCGGGACSAHSGP
jgi:putative transposase